MKKNKIAIIFILVVVGFGMGIYFKNDAVKFYDSLGKQVQNFKTTDVGTIITKASKELLNPPPLLSYKKVDSITLLQSKIISETNLQRQENGNPSTTLRTGLPALVENKKLDEAAIAKANDMFLNQYFEHTSPTGIDPGKLVQSYGYDYVVAGENLILGNFSSEKEVVQDWMNSPGHRANILNNRYTEIGVAIIKGTYKDQTVWIGVQEFGLPLSTCPEPSLVLKNQIDSDKSQLDILSSQIDNKKAQINNTDESSPAYGQMVDDYNQMASQYNSLAETVKSVIAQYNEQINAFNICVKGTK